MITKPRLHICFFAFLWGSALVRVQWVLKNTSDKHAALLGSDKGSCLSLTFSYCKKLVAGLQRNSWFAFVTFSLRQAAAQYQSLSQESLQARLVGSNSVRSRQCSISVIPSADRLLLCMSGPQVVQAQIFSPALPLCFQRLSRETCHECAAASRSTQPPQACQHQTCHALLWSIE